MTTALMVLPTAVTETKGDAGDHQLKGADLSELLTKAAVERELARAVGVTDGLEIEAVHDIHTAVWTVQVFNRTTGAGKSLYEAN